MADWENEEFEGGMLESDPTEVLNRKVTPVFFLIDVSGSMSGSKIGTVNSAMKEIMKDLSELDDVSFELRYAVLSFGSDCVWETGEKGLVPCDGSWKQLSANGLTYFNTACKMLKEKLSGKHGFFKFASGKTITPPVLILLTDGYANDGDENGLDGVEVLKANHYFKSSFKAAIAIGENANMQLCENFTCKKADVEKAAVWTAYNAKALRAILDVVVRSSVAVSSSNTSDVNGTMKNPEECEVNQGGLIDEVENQFKGNEDLTESANCAENKDITWDD